MQTLRPPNRWLVLNGDALRRRSHHRLYVPFSLSDVPLDTGYEDQARCVQGHRGQLAHGDRPAEYGFADIDGSRPDVWRYSEAVERGDRDIDPNDYR